MGNVEIRSTEHFCVKCSVLFKSKFYNCTLYGVLYRGVRILENFIYLGFLQLIRVFYNVFLGKQKIKYKYKMTCREEENILRIFSS